MRSRNQDFVLGLVVIGFITVFVGTLLWIYPHVGGVMKTVQIRFKAEDGVAPLKEGSAVTLGGAMDVGKVKRVDRVLERREIEGRLAVQLFVLITAEIEESVPLYTDCQITTDQPPVGGSGMVVISSVGTTGKPFGPGPIDGLPPQSLAAAISGLSRRLLAPDGLVDMLTRALDERQKGSLMAKLSLSLSDINEMTDSLRIQLSIQQQKSLVNKIHVLADNLADMTGALRDQARADNSAGLVAKVHLALDSLSTALSEAKDMVQENRPAVQQTMAHVESMAETLDQEILAKIKRDFDRDDPTSLLGKLHVSMDHLNKSMDDIASVTDSARGLMIVNRPLLQRTVENFKEASDQMNGAIREVLLQPWRIFNKPDAAEMKKLDVLEAARHFADAATRLDDATAKLEALVRDAPADGPIHRSDEEIQMIRDSLKSAFDRFRTAEQYLFDKMK